MKTTNWKNWAKAALVRAIRTFAEAMLAYSRPTGDDRPAGS